MNTNGSIPMKHIDKENVRRAEREQIIILLVLWAANGNIFIDIIACSAGNVHNSYPFVNMVKKMIPLNTDWNVIDPSFFGPPGPHIFSTPLRPRVFINTP